MQAVFYGTANLEVQFFDGYMTIDKFITNQPALKQQLNIIPQGRRNNTMHDIACKLLIYCQNNSLTPHNTNAFYSGLESFGFRRSKENKEGKRTSIYKGIKLKIQWL